MALDSAKKKRISLLSIVDRLAKRADTQDQVGLQAKQVEESASLSPRPAAPVRPYLLPPTPSSGPASPVVSEESQDEEEVQSDGKGSVVQDEKEEVKKEGICRQPMRCEVCGLRVFKSYRYINRSSAPAHLKNFVTTNIDRVRVCKRCFSSRERCRQNLTLILLRSKTSQMIHMRTPLGVTYNRATKAIDHIARDLRKGFKRPYDDLLCDETMADEDEMEVDEERFMLNGGEENSEPRPKMFIAENGGIQQGMVTTTPAPFKSIGLVTVVRPQNGNLYSLTPNCFTLYGDISEVKFDETASDKTAEQNGPQIDATANLKKLVDHNSVVAPTVKKNTSSEMHNINHKLTMLDHPYALQLPKGKEHSPLRPAGVGRPAKPLDVRVGKMSSNGRAEHPKKTVNQDGETTSERTCGIVCCLCDKLVTKSYSCYKKDNAPDKVKHLFAPGVKIIKICRRCLPYKKPKDGESTDSSGKTKGKMKLVKGKLVKIHSAKLVKNAKTAGKVKPANTLDKTKAPSSEKNVQKSPSKEDAKKRKDVAKDDKSKVISPKKVCSAVTQTMKLPMSKGTVSSKGPQVNVKSSPPSKEQGKTDNSKGLTTTAKAASTQPKTDSEVKSGTKVESGGSNTVKKENSTDSNQKSSGKVDSGTQSMKSMIGVRMRVKSKAANATMSSENVAKDQGLQKENESEATFKEDDKQVDVMEKRIVESVENVANQEVDEQGEGKSEGKGAGAENEADSESPATGSQEECKGESKEDDEEENKEESKTKDSDAIPGKEEIGTKANDVNVDDQKEQASKEECNDDKESVNRRERRSASKSPVRARETKPAEVSSPRRGGRNVGTPEKLRDEKQIIPSIMTRKRMASFCESESEKKTDSPSWSASEKPAPKRRAVAALLEKMSKKSSGLQTPQKDSGDDQEREVETPKQEGGHCMTRRNQAPILCARCSEKVVKSYRCIIRGQSPAHIKPLFEKQTGDMLRICRKCVKKPETVKDAQ